MGHARRPADEAVRFGQEPELTFAPAPLASFDQTTDVRGCRCACSACSDPTVRYRCTSPSAARERMRHAGDQTLSRFLDIFHHRFVTLFYRAWAQAQPHVNHDRPAEDRFARMSVRSSVCCRRVSRTRRAAGSGQVLSRRRADPPRAHAEGLRVILQHFCRVPCRSKSSSATG